MKRILGCLLTLTLLLTGTIVAFAEPFGEGQTLSLSCPEGWYSAVTLNDNLPVWQEIEKATGVHIAWDANADYDAAMQPRVAAAQQLSDIMLVPPAWNSTCTAVFCWTMWASTNSVR